MSDFNRAATSDARKATANKSLLHDRLCPDGATPDEVKGNFLKSFCPAGVRSAPCLSGPDRKLYGAALRRRTAMVSALGCALKAETEWHFATGTGIRNPLEVGLQWHPVYGVPYWPGASIRGMMRAYALTIAETTAADVREMFGEGDVAIDDLYSWAGNGFTEPEPGARDGWEGRAGRLIVFDGLPEAGVSVVRDVMTPHYGVWYGQSPTGDTLSAADAPGDWLNPVPLPFLVVPQGVTFHFGLAVRGQGDQALLARAHRWLQEALQWTGGGAKTSAGYGRFVKMAPPAAID